MTVTPLGHTGGMVEPVVLSYGMGVDRFPTVEHELVVGPAGAADKQRDSFEGSWRKYRGAA